MNPYAIPTEHQNVIIRLFKGGVDLLPQIAVSDLSILHAAVGIAGEAAELEKAVLPIRLGKPNALVDYGNITEELGDHLFYEGALRIATGLETLVRSDDTGDDPPPFTPPAWRAHTEDSLLEQIVGGASRRYLLCCMVSLHTVIAGDILDVAKKHVVYRKGLDLDKLRGLLLQDCWVIQQMVMLLDTSEVVLRAANLNKLVKGPNARYAQGYSDEAAQARADKKEGE